MSPDDEPVAEIPPVEIPVAPTLAPAPSYAAWTTAHGAPDNSGFAKVVTAPATTPSTIVDVGPLASGANPVTGKDGTLYIGNMDGELIALRPNGSLLWKRKLNSATAMYGAIFASPVVSSDGSVFVVSGSGARDHREGLPPYTAYSFLHKFTPGGGWVGTAAFPLHYGYTGATTAPPNLWSFNGAEALIIPVHFGASSQEHRLVAFSTDTMAVLDDDFIPSQNQLTGDSGLSDLPFWKELLVCVTNPGLLIADTVTEGACGIFGGGFKGKIAVGDDSISIYRWLGYGSGVAIRQHLAGVSPQIFTVGGWTDKFWPKFTDTEVYTFDVNNGFHYVTGSHYEDRVMLSPPVALATGETVIGQHTQHEDNGGLSFEPEGRYLWLDSDIYAAPTLTPNGRIATVSKTGWLSTVLYGNLEKQEWHDGPSIASAASSCTHLFVAAENELVTYDLATMQWINRMPWTDGGQHSTIIGPAGYVYATTEHGIYVFPPLAGRDPNNLAGSQCTP